MTAPGTGRVPRVCVATRSLRVASYNVHSWVGLDGRCDPERVVDVLRELDADVVALQEARALCADSPTEPLAGLCDEAGYQLLEGPTLLRGGASYGNVLLSRLPIREFARIDLTVPRREPRGALAAAIEHGGSVVQLVATHLGLRARERERQVTKLLDWVARTVATAAPDVVSLMGDFNEWRPRAATLRRIESTFGPSAAPRTFPASKPWLRLDRIWVLPGLAVRGSARVHRSERARRASDHLPVVVDLELPGARPRARD